MDSDNSNNIETLLQQLQIQANNPGACAGTQWLTASNYSTLISINPHDRSSIAKVASCDQTQYETIVTTAQQAFLEWRQIPAPQRGDIIRQIGDRLRQYKKPLGKLISIEMGKILQEGLGEVQEMIDMADLAVGQSRMLYGKTMHSERPQHRMYEQWHPLGIVGVITAFNFPVAVWAWNAFIAAIAGNTVIWKPSSKTPLCAIAIQHICNQVLIENKLPGIFSLMISHDSTIVNQLVADTRIPLISFTGSTHTGRHVAEQVAKRLGRSLLELGGNNAIIVDETADLNLVVPAVLFSAIGTAGQRCTSLRRLIIHESIYQTLCDRLVAAYQQINIGNPLTETSLMGPLIDEAAVALYQEALIKIQQAGGDIIYGGNILEQTSYYVEPTLVKAHNDWAIVQQETFAPILYLIPYQQFDAAIAIQNQSQHGLSSALFTASLKHTEHYLSTVGSDCGIANINIGTSGAEIGGAFGGEKETGGGREAGSDAWKAYMRRQTNTINWSNQLPLAQGIKFDI